MVKGFAPPPAAPAAEGGGGADGNLMSSFGEPRTEALTKKQGGAWVAYNRGQFSRVYPAGWRVDSSNYDPVPAWCCGCQIVALNYQVSRACLLSSTLAGIASTLSSA